MGEHLDGQSELTQIAFAVRAAGRLARLLNGGQHYGRERADDRNDDQELDERETEVAAHSGHAGGWQAGNIAGGMLVSKWPEQSDANDIFTRQLEVLAATVAGALCVVAIEREGIA